MNEKIKLMLVEDSRDYRHVIQFAFEDDDMMDLIGVFGTAELALRSLAKDDPQKVPDVILLDLNLPGISGLEAIPEFRKLTEKSKILVLTQSESEADVLNAIRLGASGYILKATSIQMLRHGIQTIIDGGASIDSKMALYLLNTLKQEHVGPVNGAVLTGREVEVLQHIGEGLARKQIAEKLNISHKTVANHIANIFEKLNVPNAPAAINKAYEIGLFQKK